MDIPFGFWIAVSKSFSCWILENKEREEEQQIFHKKLICSTKWERSMNWYTIIEWMLDNEEGKRECLVIILGIMKELNIMNNTG